MQVNLPTAASMVRRRQIIDATVHTLAQSGYDGTTFAAIVRYAGLSSTRMISYHFSDRSELLAQVAVTVVSDLGGAVASQVRAAQTPLAAVRAYIDANLRHMDSHRAEMAALTILMAAGALHIEADQQSSGIDALTAIIETGLATGELRVSDARVAATVVQHAIEAVPHLLRHQPDVDLIAHARDLADFFCTAFTFPGTTEQYAS